jgi:hypothetical protein
MVMQEVSRTLIVVCRKPVVSVIEHLLRREGFRDFQRGDISIADSMAVAAKEGPREVFVLRADDKSARRLAQILRACPVRGNAGDLLELYTIDHEW